MNSGIYIALGGNIGDSHKAFDTAKGYLETYNIKVLRESPRYISTPMYYTDQESFLNSVIHVEVPKSISPEQLLKVCKNCEKKIGRKKTFFNGPRLIDLDILLYNNVQILTEDLCIPHRGITERDFVIFPLNDLDPDIIVGGKRVGDILTDFSRSNIELAH